MLNSLFLSLFCSFLSISSLSPLPPLISPPLLSFSLFNSTAPQSNHRPIQHHNTEVTASASHQPFVRQTHARSTFSHPIRKKYIITTVHVLLFISCIIIMINNINTITTCINSNNNTCSNIIDMIKIIRA